MRRKTYIIGIIILSVFFAGNDLIYAYKNELPVNVLDYSGDIRSLKDRHSLAFSDQGAWFAYGFSKDKNSYGGFSGPFLMTQENGVWSSPVLSQLNLWDSRLNKEIIWDGFESSFRSYNSHLEQVYKSDRLIISQTLFFSSPHTVFIVTRIKNISDSPIQLKYSWKGKTFLKSLEFIKRENGIAISSEKSEAKGYIQVFGETVNRIICAEKKYSLSLKTSTIKPGKTRKLILTQSFIFPEYSIEEEQENIETISLNTKKYLTERIREKVDQLRVINNRLNRKWKKKEYKDLIAKTLLTLQNNWRVPAGELRYSGLFPSYHYIWFHGFWAWDSWKHAVALAQYDTELAKDQVRAMMNFENGKGFIPDCVYRDTGIEKHNYRNTKPPLSVWAVWNIYKNNKDHDFLIELYPKLIRQHYWWYKNRDHDKDGICEYGSTDGTVKAAKWESGMDNAVRFDKSKILKNSDSAFSLDQESVDLNSYLYAEKRYLYKIARVLDKKKDMVDLKKEAETLKLKIRNQFYDKKSGWFYDTDIDGKKFINVMGCEGWIPLWAKVATKEQAEEVKVRMMDNKLFNLKVPLQTLSADHPEFKPDRGYWRGPVWLDQSYFGVVGLKNYNFNKEAGILTYKLIYNADGVLRKGKSIRENYQPVTGKGLESKNFSWSAAHYLLLMIRGQNE